MVEQQQKLEEERQKKTDERQNALIAKLQENQEAITNKLDDQEAAMTQASSSNFSHHCKHLNSQHQQHVRPHELHPADQGLILTQTLGWT